MSEDLRVPIVDHVSQIDVATIGGYELEGLPSAELIWEMSGEGQRLGGQIVFEVETTMGRRSYAIPLTKRLVRWFEKNIAACNYRREADDLAPSS